MRRLPDFKRLALEAQARLGAAGAGRLLDAGKAWDLSPALRSGGALVFPHAGIETCGHEIAAAVRSESQGSGEGWPGSHSSSGR